MAVIDHEHVKLRLLYSRKKKLDKTVETLKNEVDELKVSGVISPGKNKRRTEASRNLHFRLNEYTLLPSFYLSLSLSVCVCVSLSVISSSAGLSMG